MAKASGNRSVADLLAAVADTISVVLRHRVEQQPYVGNLDRLIDYLRGVQGHAGVEMARVLFLDSGNRLLREEIVAIGSVDQVPIQTREILKRCLELDAVGIILAHNHPSGDHSASRADIELTRRVAQCCGGLGIHLLDHIVVSDRGYTSFKAEGLL